MRNFALLGVEICFLEILSPLTIISSNIFKNIVHRKFLEKMFMLIIISD